MISMVILLNGALTVILVHQASASGLGTLAWCAYITLLAPPLDVPPQVKLVVLLSGLI